MFFAFLYVYFLKNNQHEELRITIEFDKIFFFTKKSQRGCQSRRIERRVQNKKTNNEILSHTKNIHFKYLLFHIRRYDVVHYIASPCTDASETRLVRRRQRVIDNDASNSTRLDLDDDEESSDESNSIQAWHESAVRGGRSLQVS